MNYSLERFEKETDIVSYIDGYVNVEEFLPRCMECGSCANTREEALRAARLFAAELARVILAAAV